jgi:sarcinarray family protein
MEYKMKLKIIIIIILILLFLTLDIVSTEENEFGIVKAWFNEKNATLETLEGIKLRIGEPVEVKVEVISKVNGHVFVVLTEPGVTKSFDILNGPSKLDERIDNLKIESGWSNTYKWKLVPNGAWKNGNAPLNVVVNFYNLKTKNNKVIQFTIANPYILDEQYSGAVPAPEKTVSPAGTQAKEMPFLSVMFTVGALMLAWRWRRDKT